MKAKLLIVVLMLISALGYAQKIDPEQVPKDVMIALENQYTDFKVKSWKMIDGNYVASLTVEDQTGDATFTPEGKWLQTIFPIKEKELPSSMVSYFDARNKKKELKITNAELIEEPGGKSYYIMRYNKKGVGQGKDIEVTFDVKGTFISTTGSDEELADNNSNDDTPKKVSKKKAREDEYDAEEEEVKPAPKKGKEVKKQKDQEEDEEIVETPKRKTPATKPASSKTNKPATPSKSQNTEVKKTAKQDAESEEEEEEAPAPTKKDDTPRDVPQTVKAAFTKKFPKAEEVEWEVTADKTFKAKYFFRDEEQEAEYDLDGNMMTVTSSINPDVLFRPIVNYLDKKYDKYKITKAQKVVYDRKYVQLKAPQKLKNFFIVEISQKVKRSKTPKITRLWFDQTGGLIKAEEPDEWGDEDGGSSKSNSEEEEE